MSLTIREVVNQLTESGIYLDLMTNVEEIKFHPGNINVAELVGTVTEDGVSSEDIEDALSEIENAIETLNSAKRSLL